MARTKKETNKQSIAIAYIPVLHQGYLNFVKEAVGDQPLYILAKEVTDQFRPLEKDVRAVSPKLMVKLINEVAEGKVELATAASLQKLATNATIQTITAPDEKMMHQLLEEYFPNIKVTWYRPFLRWDSHKSTTPQPVTADHRISSNQFDQEMMQQASSAADRSADWWRHVGTVLVKDGQPILTTYNHHLPHEQQPYIDGEPRADFHKGENIELSSAIHAEAAAIAEAARQGISLEETALYVTTFPCPVCAKLIAHSGVKKLYYRDGYSLLDGERILKAKGVAIIRVED